MDRSLSVIVTSPDASDTLAACLASLVAQAAAAEIVVADSSSRDPSASVAAEFPGVRVLHFNTRRSVPELRWAALAHTSRPIVAVTESRCVPAPDWCRLVVEAHRRAPEAPVIGGAVALKADATARDWGLYLSEYARFAPPLSEGETRDVSGANLSYKREALAACGDQLAAGVWEVFIHERWLAEGKRLGQSPATVIFHDGMDVPALVRMRFRYGRSYAVDRCATVSTGRRVWLALGSPLLPILLTGRLARTAYQRRFVGPFLQSFAWSFLFNVAWSGGECAGYVRGR